MSKVCMKAEQALKISHQSENMGGVSKKKKVTIKENKKKRCLRNLLFKGKILIFVHLVEIVIL